MCPNIPSAKPGFTSGVTGGKEKLVKEGRNISDQLVKDTFLKANSCQACSKIAPQNPLKSTIPESMIRFQFGLFCQFC